MTKNVTIEEDLKQRLKDAMREKNRPLLDAIRNLKSEVQKAVTASSFSGTADDAFYTSVIDAYAKKLEKALNTYETSGAGDNKEAEKLRFEIDYLAEWRPQKLSEDATATLVDETIAGLATKGSLSPKDTGRVMGAIMKSHKDDIDPGLVRKLVEERLSVSAG